MMICTIKFSKARAVAILLALAIVIAAVILAMPEKEALPESSTASAIAAGSSDDLVAYLESLGYQVAQPPIECKDVVIPSDFDAVYTDYNRIQQDGGFDLTACKGKRVTLYTYAVTNYPGQPDVRCDLLVRKGRLVGGNVYTTAIDGFMHGLTALEG